LRSVLFVPAHKPGWVGKAIAAGPDGIIIDLEDSVPAARKGEAREHCGASVRSVLEAGKAAFVRVNAWGTGDLLADLLSLQAMPTGIMLPKVERRRDLSGLDRLLGELETMHGCAVGSTEIMPTFERASPR
jgi:citrate lyase subunit beta/citryl-CoA lyase